jgi:RNA polymerase sigma factor (sigma-70 family)
MRDSEGDASIMTGDPEGLAGAYDRYGDPLYKYCRSLLGDPADAADAVQDTFVIAATWTGGLGDPDRSRARLYAVARNECMIAVRGGKAAAARDDTCEGAAAGEDAAGAGDTGQRMLLEDACRGLDSAEREVIDLHLWHGLEAAEIATVLGIGRHRGSRLLSRASDQLEACLGVLLAGRAGPAGCPRLASMLADWDGNLTPSLRWWAHGHIRKCATCTARRAARARAAMPPGVSASAAMAAAAVESLRLAPGPPAALKEHTLALAAGQDPSAVAYRAVLLSRAAPAGHHGFGWQLRERTVRARSRGTRAGSASRRLRTAAAAAAVLAVVVAAVVVGMTNNAPPVKLAGATPPLPAPTAPVSSAAANSGSPAAGSSSPGPSRTHRPRKPPGHAPGPVPTVAASSTPTVTAAAPPPSQTPTPAPTPSHPTPSRTPSASAGTLIVSPPGGQLRVTPFGARIKLTAQGGPVDWSVTVSSGSGHVIIAPDRGTLQAGQSVTVAIFASRHASGRQLTVSPDGTVFTIVTGRDHRFAV